MPPALPPVPPAKVFGIGLSRTGTQSLTAALQGLGLNVVHYPTDAGTLATLARGDGRFPLLQACDGLADITTVPCLAQLDALHPGSRFVLTVRERGAWLRSCEAFFAARPAFEPARDEAHRVHLEVRRFLRAAVYGCYDFHAARFEAALDRHLETVQRLFAGRPEQLLVLDIAAGEGFGKLAPFLGRPLPAQPFPHRGRRPGDPA